MKIGINALCIKENNSGVGITALELCRQLQKYDLKNEYYIYAFPSQALTGIKIIPVIKIGNTRLYWIFCEHFILPFYYKKHKLAGVIYPAYVSSFFSRLPAVLIIHDLFVYSHASLCKKSNVIYFRLLLPVSIKQAEYIICPSEFTRQQIIKYFPHHAEKTTIIKWGGDHILIQRNKKSVINKKKYLLFAGNIEPKKNIQYFMDLAAFCRAQGFKIKCMIIGEYGWAEQKLFRRLAADKTIIYKGYIPENKKYACFRSALCLVVPSLIEGFGLTAAEAFFCDTPVFSSNQGALKEFNISRRTVFDIKKPIDSSHPLIKFLKNQQLKEKIIKDYSAQRKIYTWKNAAMAMSKILNNF